MSSSSLDGDAVVIFMRALCAVSQEELMPAQLDEPARCAKHVTVQILVPAVIACCVPKLLNCECLLLANMLCAVSQWSAWLLS